MIIVWNASNEGISGTGTPNHNLLVTGDYTRNRGLLVKWQFFTHDLEKGQSSGSPQPHDYQERNYFL